MVVVGLWCAVLGALDGEVAHLAADDAWVGSVAPGWQEFVLELDGELVVGVSQGVRGKSPGG